MLNDKNIRFRKESNPLRERISYVKEISFGGDIPHSYTYEVTFKNNYVDSQKILANYKSESFEVDKIFEYLKLLVASIDGWRNITEEMLKDNRILSNEQVLLNDSKCEAQYFKEGFDGGMHFYSFITFRFYK